MTATRRDGNGGDGNGGGDRSTQQSEGTDTREQRAVFRIPGTALIGVVLLFMCVFPFAATLPYLLVLLVVPIVLAVWIIRTRTTATRDGLTVQTLRGTRHIPWDALKGFTITPKSTVVAVLGDDTTIALPSVRTRHLPVLSLVSEGRVPDPSGVLDEPEAGTEDSGTTGTDEADTEGTAVSGTEDEAADRDEGQAVDRDDSPHDKESRTDGDGDSSR